jgi:hypothetical protein
MMRERFDEVAFAVNGFGDKVWQPTECARLGVISPFCDTDAVNFLAALPTAEKPVIYGIQDPVSQFLVADEVGLGCKIAPNNGSDALLMMRSLPGRE